MPSSRIESIPYDIQYTLFGLLDSLSLKSLSQCSSPLRRVTAPHLWRSIRYSSLKARLDPAFSLGNFGAFVQDVSGTFIRRLCLDFGAGGVGVENSGSMIAQVGQGDIVPFSDEIWITIDDFLRRLTHFARNITQLVCSYYGPQQSSIFWALERNWELAPNLMVFVANMNCDAGLGRFLHAHKRLHTLHLPLSTCDASTLDVHLPSLRSIHIRTLSQSDVIRGQPIKSLSIDILSQNLQSLERALSFTQKGDERDVLEHLSIGFHNGSSAAICAPRIYTDLVRIPALMRLRRIGIKFSKAWNSKVNGHVGIADVLIPALSLSLEELVWEGSQWWMHEEKLLEEWVGKCFEVGKALHKFTLRWDKEDGCGRVQIYERQVLGVRLPWKMIYSA